MRRALHAIVTVALVCLVIEAAAYATGRVLARRSLVWIPADTEGYAEYLAARDPELGWPSPRGFGVGELDARGARITPGLAPTLPECGFAYGDSFTYGVEVAAADAYPTALGRTLGCRVVNFGVGSYGTDQALLRHRRHPPAPGRFVVLGHYSEDIVRNVNQLRDLQAIARFGLKPRFLLRDRALELVPLPTLDAAAFAGLADDGAHALPHEYFRPGGAAGVVPLRFPFTLRLARLPWHYRLRAWRAGVPSYQPFYASDHPSGAFEVTLAILLAFDREARARSETPIVLLVPDVADLWALEAGRPLPYAPLADALRARGIVPVDAGPALFDRLAGREACALYTRCGAGHLTPEGNAVVAEVVARRIREGEPAEPAAPTAAR